MRGYTQAVSARLLAIAPGRRWSTWLEHTKQTRAHRRGEQLELIERLDAEQRRARRAGEYAPDLRPLR